MNATTALAATLLLCAPALAQSASMKPLDASFLRLYSETNGFLLGRPANPKPTPDGKLVLFLRSGPKNRKRSLYEFNTANGQTRELLSPDALLKGAAENLSPEEKARRERMRVSAGGFADFTFDPSGQYLLLPLSGKLFVFDRKAEKARELKTPAGTILDAKWSPDGLAISYVRDHDVYVYKLATDTETAVTQGGTELKTHGLAEFVAQEEMGRFTGYWWSPDSKFIAYEEADHTGVETWYVADPTRPDQRPIRQYYPRPGKKNVAVRLGIVPVTGGKTVWVNWDSARYEYLAAVRWDKRGPLTIQLQDRKQQELALLKVNPETGAIERTLLVERDPAFTNIRQDMPQWLSGDSFAWVTERTPTPTLTIRGADGRETLPLRPPVENVGSVAVVDPAVGLIAYVASQDPSQAHVYVRAYPDQLFERTPLSEKPRRLGTGEGVESIVYSENRETYVLTQTTPGQMPQAAVYHKNQRVGELPSVALEPPVTPNVHFEKLGGEGEVGFWTAIVRPRNFDPAKKYPVLVDVYGGPHHLHVVRAMRNWLIAQYLADQGFVVVAIDNRGTPGRGRDWERAVYGKFGTVPLDDQVRGLQLLTAKHPECGPNRVGIIGWSFGGYMAAQAVLRRPDVFRAAVAGAPVTDWEDYDTHYTERYMGTLPDARSAYDAASLLPLAPKLDRPLLLVHGTADDNVYYRHTLRLSDALTRAGRPFEVMPLPGVTHMVTADPVIYERYMSRAAEFFRVHLGK